MKAKRNCCVQTRSGNKLVLVEINPFALVFYVLVLGNVCFSLCIFRLARVINLYLGTYCCRCIQGNFSVIFWSIKCCCYFCFVWWDQSISSSPFWGISELWNISLSWPVRQKGLLRIHCLFQASLRFSFSPNPFAEIVGKCLQCILTNSCAHTIVNISIIAHLITEQNASVCWRNNI